LNFLQKFYKNDHILKLQQFSSIPFVRITHAQAVSIILDDIINKNIKFKELPTYDGDLGSEHEKYLTDVKYKHPVIVMRYPKVVKAFYMPIIIESIEESHGIEHVDSFDILVPGVGELVGGSQRISKTEDLIRRINELGLDIKPLEFYVNLRKYGSQPHGGCGIGFERLIKFVTGVENVKDCVAFPRFMECAK
jgi:asparaginyl-tRNA synthetase